jgi:hypothetical protein
MTGNGPGISSKRVQNMDMSSRPTIIISHIVSTNMLTSVESVGEIRGGDQSVHDNVNSTAVSQC